MAVLMLPVKFIGLQGSKVLQTSFDNEISHSRINPTQLAGLETPILLGRPMALLLSESKRPVVVEYCVCLDFFINGFALSDEFLVVSGLGEETIIGGATIRKWRMKLNHELNSIQVKAPPGKISIPFLKSVENQSNSRSIIS
jgi:hypothetical protein